MDLGEWLSINGDAIYETQPWSTQNDTVNGNVWYTQKDDVIYGITVEWPEDNQLKLGAVHHLFQSGNTTVSLLEKNIELEVGIKI